MLKRVDGVFMEVETKWLFLLFHLNIIFLYGLTWKVINMYCNYYVKHRGDTLTKELRNNQFSRMREQRNLRDNATLLLFFVRSGWHHIIIHFVLRHAIERCQSRVTGLEIFHFVLL